MNLDIELVRGQFPALSEDWAFFDNAGGSQVAAQVADRLYDFFKNTNVQPGPGYEVSRRATRGLEEAVDAMARLVNAPDPSEVVLGPSTTMLLRNLALSLVETFEPGDEVIVTNCDHEANIGAWRYLEKRGITVKTWTLNPDTLNLSIDDLEALMTDKTRLVAVGHVSNILGTINPIKEIAAAVHRRGAMICVDGVAYAPHALVDVQDLDVDFYVFSLYKVYGPHWAMLYARRSILETLPCVNHFFLKDKIPGRLQPGGLNYELTYSLLGLRDYLTLLAHGTSAESNDGFRESAQAVFDAIAGYEEQLSARFLDFLNSRPAVRIIGETRPDRNLRMPTFSFVVEGTLSSTIPSVADREKVGVSSGDFYARRLIEDLGLMPMDGVVRVSMVHYNTIEEVDRLIRVLETMDI